MLCIMIVNSNYDILMAPAIEMCLTSTKNCIFNFLETNRYIIVNNKHV